MRKYLFWIIIFVFVLAKLFTIFTFFHYIGWDESVYLGMGKAIYSLGKQGLWEEIRPPLLPAILGMFWKIMPQYYTKIAEIIMLFFSLGVFVMLYLIAKTIASEKNNQASNIESNKGVIIAIVTILLLSTTAVFFAESSKVMTEIASSFLILVTLYLVIKKSNPYLIGLSAALAAVMKYPNLLLFAIILVFLIIEAYNENDKNQRYTQLLKKIAQALAGFCTVVIPFLVMNYLLYAQYTTSLFHAVFQPLILGAYHQSNIVHQVNQPVLNLFYYPISLAKQHVLLLLAFFSPLFLVKRDSGKEVIKKKHLLLFWTVIAVYLTYFTSIINKQERFLLLILPLFALLAAEVMYETYYYCQQRYKQAQYLIAGFFAIVFVLAVFHNVAIVQQEITISYSSEQPEIVTNYYYFFNKATTDFGAASDNISIITTDPRFAAYSDARYIAAYNNVTDLTIVFSQYKKNATAVVFDSAFYPCTNLHCTEYKQFFKQQLMENYQLLYNRTDQDSQKFIFLLDNSSAFH